MICPHCHREQKDNAQTICQFCKKSLHLDSDRGINVLEAQSEAKFRALKSSAAAGDARDQYRLGLLYYQGTGCERNLNQAVRCFEGSAKTGFAAAEYALALCLLKGEGADRDVRRVLNLLAQASRHGHPGAAKLLQEIGQTYRDKTKNQITFYSPERAKGKKNQVRSVYFLPVDNANTCPNDQYELYRQVAYLACYSFDPLQIKGFLRLPLLRCSQCDTWFVSRSIVNLIKNEGFEQKEIDIINSPDNPRSPELEQLYKVPQPAKKLSGRSTSKRSSKKGKSTRRKKSDLHLAIRCQYCDGGKTGTGIGFKGICSPENYRYHKKNNSTSWCASKENTCQSWSENKLDNKEYPCSECHLLLDWACSDSKAGAGKKSVRKIAGNRTGQIAVLTTVFPGADEKNRRVFALFLICEPEEPRPGEICADPVMRIELLEDEIVNFWDHYQGGGRSDRPIWGSPFYRNLSDSQIRSILTASLQQIKDPQR